MCIFAGKLASGNLHLFMCKHWSPVAGPLTSEGLRGRGAGGLRLLPAQEIHRAREVRGLSPAGVGAGPLGPPLTHLWSLSP